MNILGIETSCDETSVAILNDKKEILSHKILSQIDIHKEFGGVVPEVAARAHLAYLPTILRNTFSESNMSIDDIDIVAATAGPGLIGGLLVGLMTGKSIAYAAGKKFVAVNHLEAHALTIRMTSDIEFPYLMLLVSGGHCQILVVKGVGQYELLGHTLDDALGEAFDKVSKMLGLGYPGGPIIEKMALSGNPNSYSIPKSMIGRAGCDFSFSGIKTFVRNLIYANYDISKSEEFISNIAASFQATVCDIIIDRISNAISIYSKQFGFTSNNLVIAGGVAANQYIGFRLKEYLNGLGWSLFVPPIKLCTDNAAMIAWAGYEKYISGFEDHLDYEPKASWPLA